MLHTESGTSFLVWQNKSYSYTAARTRDLVARLLPSLLIDVGGSRIGVPQAGVHLIVNHVLRTGTTESIRLCPDGMEPFQMKHV